uniref:LigA n=1 Tax=Parastrongyloides trichosuri TaxID=131310 RepID=A0A0N4Z875_PARTI
MRPAPPRAQDSFGRTLRPPARRTGRSARPRSSSWSDLRDPQAGWIGRQFALDHAGGRALGLRGVAEEAGDLDLRHPASGQGDRQARLAADHRLARRLDVEAVAGAQTLAGTAADIDGRAGHPQDVGEPGPLLQLVDDIGHGVRDGRRYGPIVQRRVIARAAAEARNLAGLRRRLPGARGGEEDAARAHVDQTDLDRGVDRLTPLGVKEALLALVATAQLGDRAQQQGVDSAQRLAIRLGQHPLGVQRRQIGPLEDKEVVGRDKGVDQHVAGLGRDRIRLTRRLQQAA